MVSVRAGTGPQVGPGGGRTLCLPGPREALLPERGLCLLHPPPASRDPRCPRSCRMPHDKRAPEPGGLKRHSVVISGVWVRDVGMTSREPLRPSLTRLRARCQLGTVFSREGSTEKGRFRARSRGCGRIQVLTGSCAERLGSSLAGGRRLPSAPRRAALSIRARRARERP